jgi:hypothetical protein
VKDADGNTVPGCCRYVHPGEEGTGRRLFPERTVRDTLRDGVGKIVQPACVRLTGRAGFYERRHLRMPWSDWCALHSIPYKRNEPGVKHEPVKRVPFGKKPITVEELERSLGADKVAVADEAARCLITDGIFERMKEPAFKEKILAEVAKEISENPEKWADTIATIKAMQDEERAV